MMRHVMMHLRRRLAQFFLHLFYRKLWAQILPIILITVSIPIILLGFLLIRTSQEAVRNSVLSNHKEIATRAAAEITLFMKRAEDILNTTGTILSVKFPAPWKQETILVELVLDQPIFMRAVSVDLAGRLIAGSELGRELEWEYPKDVLEKIQKGKNYISEVKMLDNHTPYVTMVVPLKKLGKTVGILIADANLRGIWDIVDTIKLGSTGNTFLVSQDGTLIAHYDKKLVLKKTNLSAQKDVQLALSGKTGSMETVDTAGEKLLSSYAPISRMRWGIVLEQNQEEAYLFSKIMKTQSWMIIIASEILAILVSLLIAHFLTRPIKTLVSKIKSVADGDLDHRIEIKKRDEIGELIRSFNDMTGKLKRAEENTRLSAIGEAAAWITHELKNSLILIKSFVHLFPQQYSDKDFVSKFSRLIPPEICRWEHMLNELSGLSSCDQLKIARTSITELLGGTLEMMSEKLKKRKIDIQYVQQSNNLYLMADEERLKQVFINLIINAMNAMPEGGSLIASAGFMPGGDINNQKHIEVNIRDTGRGIPAESLVKIFKPFHTNHNNRVGLGLTIARRIIEQHGGNIKAESEMGVGTTFIITLPVEMPLSINS